MIFILCFIFGFILGNVFLIILPKKKIQKIKNKSKFQQIIEQSKDL